VPEPAGPETKPRHLVVIGASAGGVEALCTVVAGLPADLPATVGVVLHIAARGPSVLATILGRAGALPCRPAVDGAPLREGEILVAPPGHHLAIADGRVSVSTGPRENGLRPSVDVLFRTAAETFGPAVIGVVLSGTRDDGTAGLSAIKAHGGSTIVQDPEDAMYPGMPASALAHVRVNAVVPADRVAETIVRMVTGEFTDGPVEDETLGHDVLPGEEVVTICPECGGVLSERREAGLTQWRCQVGHRYSPASLADAQAHTVESALWAAVRALEDRRVLLERMATQQEARGQQRSAEIFRQRAAQAGRQAQRVHEALHDGAATAPRRLAHGLAPATAGNHPR
jgi:two-component system chemotaxis response regulator CheB